MRRRVCLAAVAVIAVASCGPKAVVLPARTAECWEFVQQVIRSPSTAEVVSFTDGERQAFVTFDADNAYGTPVRTTAWCKFGDTGAVEGLSIDGRDLDPAEVAAAGYGVAAARLREPVNDAD